MDCIKDENRVKLLVAIAHRTKGFRKVKTLDRDASGVWAKFREDVSAIRPCGCEDCVYENVFREMGCPDEV